MAIDTSTIRAAFVPVWASNPYHRELEGSLRQVGIEVLDTHDLKGLYTAVKKGAETVDVVHLHALPYFAFSAAAVARYARFYLRLKKLRDLGVRVVWTVHDLQNHDSTYARVEDRVSQYLAGHVDALIVHGESARKIVESRWRLTGRSVCVIPHGNFIHSYPNTVKRKEARAALGLEPTGTVFLFLGLIRPYKGVLDLVKAFRSSSAPTARLVIAGRPVDAAIEAEVAASVQGDARIRFVPGFVADDDVQRYMNACDVVVLPYKRVFTSGAAILAMSFAKACIAPRAGCVTDSLDEDGNVLFDPTVDGDLDRALRDAINRADQLDAMGLHNFQRASGWGWARVAQATAAVYRRCVARRTVVS